MKRKTIRSLTAITLRAGALVLGIWLLSMGLFTVGTAQYVLREVREKGQDFAGDAGNIGDLQGIYQLDRQDDLQNLKAIPGYLDNAMLQCLTYASVDVNSPGVYGSDGTYWSIYPSVFLNCDTALAFVDAQGNVLHQSGDAVVYFDYVTQEGWEQAEETMPTEGYAWLDLSDPSDQRYQLFRNFYEHTGQGATLLSVEALRLTGVFDGTRFEPYAISIMDNSSYNRALQAWMPEESALESSSEAPPTAGSEGEGSAATSGSGTSSTPPHTYGLLDSLGYVEWQELFDNTAQADPSEELVTIYGTRPFMTQHEAQGPVRYQGEAYSSLLDLLLAKVPEGQGPTADFWASSQMDNLWSMVVFSAEKFTDYSGYDLYSPEEPLPEPDFTLLAAVQASPLKIAAKLLWKIYLATGVLALLGILLIRRGVRKNLTQPLAELERGMELGWVHLPNWNWDSLRWKEISLLVRQYQATHDQLHKDKNEIARLNASLDYAQRAEETRRQMISHLAHQLKTPLAVIHGYAECLREHIAEEKRDRYVEGILAESQRSDRMVLEMLDFSRLAAGKIKLSRDNISLLSLSREILDKLELPIQAKGLEVTVSPAEEFFITADESRISQVLENFLTNAVKYTPSGGWIRVRIQREPAEALFTVENQSAPLSQQALRSVWLPFYRTEEAQTEQGTGLGLAIAKSIIELHGGKCFAQNLEQGVAFGFKIPL